MRIKSLVVTDRGKRLIGRYKLILKNDIESDQYEISHTKFNKNTLSCYGDTNFRER